MTKRPFLNGILFIIGFVSLLVYGLPQAYPDEDELIPRKAIFSSLQSYVILSPNGQHIAFGRSAFGAPTISSIAAVSDISNSKEVRLKNRGLAISCMWDYRSEHLIFVQQSPSGPRIVTYNVDTASETIISRGGDRIVGRPMLRASTPESMLIRTDDGNGEHTYWRTTITGGERNRVATIQANEELLFDDQFRPRVLVRPSGLCEVELLRPAAHDTWERFRRLACDYTNLDGRADGGVRKVLGVDSGGEHLYLVDNTDRDKSALLKVKIDTGETTVLASDSKADIAPGVLLSPRTQQPLLAFAHFGKRRHYAFDTQLKADFEYLESELGCQVDIVETDLDGNTWIILTLDGGPGIYYLFDRSTRSLQRLFPRFPAMDEYPLASRSSHTVTVRDGMELPCHLYLPRDADPDRNGVPSKPLPTVIYVHGGPSARTPWDDWNGRTVRSQQLLANRGYAALRIEFRGSGGFGNAFRESGHRKWGTDAIQDVVDIAKWAIDAGIADPGRIGIWGFSHGGYATLAALSNHPDVFACGFSWSGGGSNEAKVTKFEDTEYAEIIFERYGDNRTVEGKRLLREQSPQYSIHKIRSPLLIAHGGKDSASPLDTQVNPVIRLLTEHNKTFTFVLFPKEVHGFARSASWISLWAVAERFFAEHLGGRYEPFPDNLSTGTSLEAPFGAEQIPGLDTALR